ncbi:uncharacterized protein LOC111338965 [Stylophora pistillata]|uniref:uncharacterized protein LOC111338965 n=1 Tax=Stylophora pistillata TaxID=50429 RepID=UPI000C055968|nr:uncharacterized protein LOC111338965 [Stylophora pistillata]
MYYVIFNTSVIFTEGIHPHPMETKESNLNPGISRKKAAQEKKAAAKRAREKAYYQQNKEKKIAQIKERRKKLQAEKSIRPQTRSIAEKTKRQQKETEHREASRTAAQEKRDKKRQQTRERVRKYREKKRTKAQDYDNIVDYPGFANRMSKKRATDKVKKTLPSTPRKKAEIVQSIVKSPRTRKVLCEGGLLKTPEDEKETETLRALASDISEGLSHVKRSGSNEKRTVFKAFKSLAFGEEIKKAKAKKSVGKLVNLGEKSISRAIEHREKILKGEVENWLYAKRKVRGDALTDEESKVIYDYWTNTASRPTGDKKDFSRKRIGKKEYIHHAKHVLEKTQTEAFIEFTNLHPEIKVKQRKFETLKPFFVRQARERDRKSCLCRKHVETQIVFSTCMKFRKAAMKTSAGEDTSVLVPKTLSEVVESTLCSKPEGAPFHNIKCLQRECDQCGVALFKLLPTETSDEGSVKWSRYDYIPTGKFLANGQEKKKIALIQKETPPSELFQYFRELLAVYPSHSFMAKWQREQLDNLLDNLPVGHVVCVHDYSEGYTCRQQDEIQSEYFDVAKVSLHVTILHRHAVEEVDGVASTEEDPHLVKEHIFVISDDPVQDYDSVHTMQEFIQNYLTNDLGYNTQMMHEFTDGCAAQYKSRHCIGDLSCSLADFGFPIQRNYFETSHAKGEQDAAGSHVKQKVSQAVLRRTATITSARSMHDFLVQHFSQPAPSSFSARTKSVQLKRRIFHFVPSSGEGSVVRNRAGRKFTELKGIRKLHCVKTTPQQGKVFVRHRSCYCISCIVNDEENCTNKAWLDEWKMVELAREGDLATTRQATEAPILDHDTASYIADLASKGSTVAIAAEDDPVYDFYLLQVTSDGVEELDSNVTDDYQCHYYRGDRVLKGHFYIRENIHDMTFTIDEKRKAFVHAATVRHICGDLPVRKRGRKSIYKLPLKENEEIIASM